MLNRRTLALYTVLCFLFGIVAIPAGPRLVCRMTGRPMALVAATSPAHEMSRSCCAVGTQVMPDGAIHYRLSAPGCCDLWHGFERADQPAVVGHYHALALAVLAPIPGAIHLPVAVAVAFARESPREVAPRGPPLTACSPRAPPYFS